MKKELVFNKEAEQSVLAACLLVPEFAEEALPQLTLDHFHIPIHQSVLVAMQALREKGKPCDSLSVRDYLAAKKSKVSALDVVALADMTYSVTSCRYHLEILKRCELQRRILRACVELEAMASDPQEDIESVRRQVLDTLLPLTVDMPKESDEQTGGMERKGAA